MVGGAERYHTAIQQRRRHARQMAAAASRTMMNSSRRALILAAMMQGRLSTTVAFTPACRAASSYADFTLEEQSKHVQDALYRVRQ